MYDERTRQLDHRWATYTDGEERGTLSHRRKRLK